MKWSSEQVDALWELAYAGVPNKEIAAQLGVHINDVYAKRSQLGITIDKMVALKEPPVTKESLLKDLLKWFKEGIEDGFTVSGPLCKEVAGEIRAVLK